MVQRQIQTNHKTDSPAPADAVWLTWEVQRRTTELARRLGIDLVRLLHDGPRWRRYPALAAATLGELRRRRPRLLVVQNPSLILTVLVAVLKPWMGYGLVVDRHSNFALAKPPGLKRRLFVALSDFTLRRSDLTIVTNEFLAGLVNGRGGRALVLQDPLPDLTATVPAPTGGDRPRQGMFVCTYAPDEPYEEVILAAAGLDCPGRLVVTGRPPTGGLRPQVQAAADASPRIELTGFLPDQAYVDTLQASDFVMVLTRSEWCLVCGAYEGIALGKPLILSNRQALREYFGDQHIFVEDTAEAIAAALARAFAGELPGPAETEALRRRLADQWQHRFGELDAAIGALKRPEPVRRAGP